MDFIFSSGPDNWYTLHDLQSSFLHLTPFWDASQHDKSVELYASHLFLISTVQGLIFQQGIRE